jgi:hypothetical protein
MGWVLTSAALWGLFVPFFLYKAREPLVQSWCVDDMYTNEVTQTHRTSAIKGGQLGKKACARHAGPGVGW